MSAYVIVHATIKDPAKMKTYAVDSAETLAPFGGEFVFRGDVAQVLTGAHDHQRAAVLRFPDQAAVKSWYSSPAYQALIPNRDEAADMVFIGYDEI